jgi:DNA-binding response OmpR family regulator
MKALRVLVVEDEAVIAALLAEVLEAMGHDVCGIEATESDAVAAVARCKPDLMIVDVWLADGNGVSAVKEICRTGPVPCVFVTADMTMVHALSQDAEIIHKPYREPDLVHAMQRALAATAPVESGP